MSDNSFSLRSEAGPIPYWKHHKRAQESINFIMQLIEEAADRVNDTQGIPGDGSVDTNRASRICFVSGEPGSGKSTLYLTLRAMLTEGDKTYHVGYNKDGLSALKGNVKLLDTLDLEVAGDEGENLLAAVLVRLFRKLGTPNSTNSKDCMDAIKDLEELATDIGIAWEGNLQARAVALDTDTYSGEVMRTQDARLQINERLRDALAKLAKNKCSGCDENTLFVLPVDDLYLKPSASLQLLRLLRMISIPRLFFLVMGDINTVEALFIEKSLADWTGVAGSELFSTNPERLDEALTRARELRARYLRKLLPPGQRTTIEAMDWDEAMDFETGSSKNPQRFEKLLEEVKLDPEFHRCDSEDTSLLNFLVAPPFSKEEQVYREEQRKKREKGDSLEKDFSETQSLKKDRAAYTALQILDATPREMMDLGSAFHEVIKKTNDDNGRTNNRIPKLLLSIRNIVNLVREEHSFLNEKAQKVLEGVLPTRVYDPEDINFKMDVLKLEIVARNWTNDKSKKIWFRRHRSWDLTVNEQKNVFSKEIKKSVEENANENIEKCIDNVKGQYDKLPPRPTAWFVLLHDLAWRWKKDSVTGNPVERLCEELNDWNLIENEDWNKTEDIYKINQKFSTNQKSDYKAEDYFKGWAVLNEGKTHKHFPMPIFDTFWKLDRFLYIWTCGLDWLTEKNEGYELDRIIDLWGLAGWAILSEENSKRYEEFSKGKSDWFKTNLETFKNEENDLIKPWISDMNNFSTQVKKLTEQSHNL